MTSVTGQTAPTYDANGNTTRDETNKTMVYDAWNRLVQVKDSAGATLGTFAYDALGRMLGIVVREGKKPSEVIIKASFQMTKDLRGEGWGQISMIGREIGEEFDKKFGEEKKKPRPLTDKPMRYVNILWGFSYKDRTGHIGIGQPGQPVIDKKLRP